MTPILKQITKYSSNNLNAAAEDGHLLLFSENIAIEVLYVNMEHVPDAFSNK